MSRTAIRPYLIAKDAEGIFRITVRTTRFNSQGYPLVSSSVVEEAFTTATAAKAYAKVQFRAETGDFATK